MNRRKASWKLTPSQNNHFVKSQRYSHLEACSPRPSYSSGMAGSSVNHKIAGPLLTSTPINYNLSTYMDSKSPGLSERVVQYSNESQECRATHQTKYRTPGVFPVIHLFKKNLPVRMVSPSKVTMQVTLQESAMHNMENVSTSEEIAQSSHARTHLDDRETSIGAHSVLDALKEISRKRIHSGDQCLQLNSYKRNRRECYIDSADAKSSNESISSDNNTMTPAVQLPKVPCIMNDITASLTSTHAYPLQPKNHSPATITRVVQEKEAQSHAETQTENILQTTEDTLKDSDTIPAIVPDFSTNVSVNKSPSFDTEEISLEDLVDERSKEVSEGPTEFTPALIFNEMSSETTRKNKMAVLLSALTGTEAKPVTKSKEATVEKGSFKSDSSPLQIKPVSIMSPHDKPKHDKHVTFVIPEKENIVKEPSSSLESSNGDAASVINNDKIDSKLQPEISLPLPIKNNEDFGKHNPVKMSSDKRDNVGIPIQPVLFSTVSSPSIPKPANTTNVNKVFEMPFTKEHKSESNITNEVIKASYKSAPAPAISNSSKLGGFKFDFQNRAPTPTKPTSSSSLSSGVNAAKPIFSFTNSTMSNTATSKMGLSSAIPNIPNSVAVSPKTFSGISFNYNTSPKMSSTAIVSSTDAGFKAVTYPQFTSPPAFGTNTTVTSAFGTSIFSTGLNTNPTVTTSTSSNSTPFGTGALSNNTVAPNFNINQIFNKNPSQELGFKFNTTKVASTTASIFNTPILPSAGLNVPNSNFAVPNSFNTTTAVTTSSNMFSFVSNAVKAPALSSAPSEFASPVSANATVFNPTSTPSVFNKPTNEPHSFALNAPKQPPSSFGHPSIFGGEAPLPKSVFDTAGSNQNNNPFGNNVFADTNFKGSTFEFNSSQKNPFNSVNAPPQTGISGNIPQTAPLSNNAYSGMFSVGAQPSNAFPPSESVFGTPIATPSANTMGNSANSPFNNSGFGNGFPAAFNTPTAGMFNIGSGTSSSKARTQLKARRRT